MFKCEGCPEVFISPNDKQYHKRKNPACKQFKAYPGPPLSAVERLETPQQRKNRLKREARRRRNQERAKGADPGRSSPPKAPGVTAQPLVPNKPPAQLEGAAEKPPQ